MRTRVRRLATCALSVGLLLFGPLFSSSANGVFIQPFDSYGNLCWEDEQIRLDNFAIQMQQSPDLVGDIVVYAGRHSCPGEAKYRAERAKKWVLKRGVKSERIQTRDGGYREDVHIVLVLAPKDTEPLSLNPTLTKEEVSVKKRCVDKVFAKVLCLNR